MTLVEFLLARIAEVKRDSYRLTPGSLPPLTFDVGSYLRAECDAKRRLVEWSAAAYAPEYEAYVLPLLALPYADHPDYKPEWRP